MNAQEQISKLQGLLARIQRNASASRSPAPAAVAAPNAAPPVAAPPSYAAPSYAAPVRSASDQSVDELLGASAQPSEPPPGVDVAVEHLAPPAAAAASSPSEVPDAEPIPLVAASAPQAEQSATEEAFALESEVSEVRITTGMREPAIEVTVAAIEAEAETIGTEELSEEDLVEVTEATPAPAQAAGDVDVDIDFEDEAEQPPASSKRKVATSMDEALAAAAEQLDQEREVPIKTPPPESGPQEAPPVTGFAAPAAPDVDALLDGELEIPTREAVPAVPAPEQLGQTIDLGEVRGPSLELAEHRPDAPAPARVEELEVALPGRDAGGGYDDNLQPPPEARDDLEAHRRRLEDDIPPPPESLATLPSVQPGPAPELVPLGVAPAAPALLEAAAPEIIARPVPAGSPEGFTSLREAFRPSSFSELLDASLSLNGY